MKKIGIIIQARMSSTRLPRKAMIKIKNKPVITHIIERLSLCKNADQIILSTSEDKSDDDLAKLAEKLNIAVFRGSLDDVLDRFYKTAEAFKLDTIVRITGDCPIIDPVVVDKTISNFVTGSYDLFSVGPKFPDGLDCQVFSREALCFAWQNAKLRSEREHVCPYIEKNPEIFKLGSKDFYPEYNSLRLTLDEKKDLDLIIYIYKNLYNKKNIFLTEDVIKLYKSNNLPFKKNIFIKRNEGYLKSLKDD